MFIQMLASKKNILVIGPKSLKEVFASFTLSDLEFNFILPENLKPNSSHWLSYQLIIIDSQIKGLQDAFFWIRTINHVTNKKMPIIFLTNEGEEKKAVSALSEGVSDALSKEELVPVILHMAIHRAIEKKRWQQIYQNLSNSENTPFLKDPLTGIYNLAYLKTRLAEEKTRSKRYHFPLSLILINIDQFSEINKKYGTPVGDQILKDLGQMLSRNTRSSDLLARVKDDYFALLLTHTGLDQAKAVWERMQGQIMKFPFMIKEDNYFLTARAILISLNEHHESLDKLIAQAEIMLKKISPKDNDNNLCVFLA